MKYRKFISGLSVLICTMASSSSFAIDESLFSEISLAAFEKTHPFPKKEEFQIDTSVHGLKTEALFTGNTRPLSKEKRKALNFLSSIQKENKKLFLLYEDEIEVVQDDKTFWIPVQRQLLPVMKHELKDDQSIWLYVRYMGAAGADRIYLMIHFSHSGDHESETAI